MTTNIIILYVFGIFTTVFNWSVVAKEYDNGCKGKLPSACDCSNKFVIECIDAELTDTDIFLQIRHEDFPELQELTLTGNTFASLEPNLFGLSVEHKQLKLLNLSHNAINFIRGRAFDRLPNLEVLDLSDNEIEIEIDSKNLLMFTSLPRLKTLKLNAAFNVKTTNLRQQIEAWHHIFQQADLSELNHLYLDNNELFYLPSRFLCSFPALTLLSLQENSFKYFKSDLECMSTLIKLDLFDNEIKYVDDRLMQLVDNAIHLQDVDLRENPFACDCHLRSFVQWAKGSDRIQRKHGMQCDSAVPDSLVDQQIVQLQIDQLQCNDGANAYIHNVYIVIGVCFLGLLVLLACLLWVNRRKLCQQAKKVQITSRFRGYNQLNKEPEVQAEFV